MSKRKNESNNIIQFEIGCRRCGNLVRTGKNTYTCNARVHMDDSTIIPIENGEHTSDWNACEGEEYIFNPVVKKSNSKSS